MEGKVALVSGGGQGIGEGIVQCLAEEGADISIITRSGDSGARVAADITAKGRKCLAIKADVTADVDVGGAVEETLERFGRIDILVNSVGGGSVEIGPFVDQSDDVWDRTFELNVKSQVHTCRAVVPHLQKQQSGKIINIASIGGKKAMASNTPYGSSKAGVIYFTKALAFELGRDNINVNCVCPGAVYTPTFAGLIDRYMLSAEAKAKGMTPRDFFEKFMIPSSPLKREITTRDVGRSVVFLASERARNITGQTINISAGTALDID